MLTDHDTFFKQLTELFEKSKETGHSIWLTHKRLTHDGTSEMPEPPDGAEDLAEYPCFIRVMEGKQTRLSTRVDPGDLPRFHAVYGTLLKASLSPLLRKRDKKREKLRQEAVQRKRQRMQEPVALEGPKRGAGRKKLQRRLKAATKQDEMRRRVEEREEARKVKAAGPSA